MLDVNLEHIDIGIFIVCICFSKLFPYLYDMMFVLGAREKSYQESREVWGLPVSLIMNIIGWAGQVT